MLFSGGCAVECCVVWCGLAWPGLAWPGLAWPGLAERGAGVTVEVTVGVGVEGGEKEEVEEVGEGRR